ncbi:MAG TPA: IS1634 family transposase [Treponema sp.]|nr:IS1634 family transposase [Treponema sp.]
MYLKKSKQKNGRIYLSIAEGYYDRATKRTKTVNVKSLGYLDVLKKDYEDPIAFFTAEVERMNEEEAQKKAPTLLKIDMDERLPIETKERKNFGYAAFSRLYHQLAIDKFIKNRQKYFKADYDHNSILKLLVYARLLYPESKKKTFEEKRMFFEKFNFTLPDIYRSLKFFKKYKNDLMLWIHRHIKAEFGRNTDLVYYDVTNYYFEIDKEDEMRRKGMCKEHKPNPIVQMGLFMDTKGIPIYYGLFSGNTNDSLTLTPMMNKILDDYELGRIIVVADRGVISGDNIAQTIVNGNGYVFGYSVKRSTSEVKKYVLDQTDYRIYEDTGKTKNKCKTDDKKEVFKIKSKVTMREIYVTDYTTGKKEKVEIDEKHVVFYSSKYAAKAKEERAEAIAKAREYVKNPSKYNHAQNYGAAKYIQNLKVDKDTGEILEEAKQYLRFDEEKLMEEEKYDGYYILATSELDVPDEEIKKIYRGLWKIEETFKVSKGEIQTRPIYLSRKDHIDAHFLTCFIALVLERILEMLLNYKYQATEILESLERCSCSPSENNIYTFDFYNQTLKDIGDIVGIDFSRKYMPLGEIKKVIGETKKCSSKLK